jgi:hypothetical protein
MLRVLKTLTIGKRTADDYLTELARRESNIWPPAAGMLQSSDFAAATEETQVQVVVAYDTDLGLSYDVWRDREFVIDTAMRQHAPTDSLST